MAEAHNTKINHSELDGEMKISMDKAGNHVDRYASHRHSGSQDQLSKPWRCPKRPREREIFPSYGWPVLSLSLGYPLLFPRREEQGQPVVSWDGDLANRK